MISQQHLDLLRSNLSRVKIPEPTDGIFKNECCISFDSPKSEGGLFIDLFTFLAFGKDYVSWHYEKSGNPVYLHIKQGKKLLSQLKPSKRPTLFPIGIDGGFVNDEPGYEETLAIVILPDYVSLPFPSAELPEKVRLTVDAIILADGAERKQQLASWIADKKEISAHAMNLRQIDNGVVIPRSGWKCAKCEKTDNLWVNLSDGMILCGRKNWDGSGGNNHGFEHYEQTGYPLAAKLDTITADLEAADVFSYPEDDYVLDPHLAQHLAFFGIDFSSLRKTERELDQNTSFDWNRIQESGQEVEPVFGPGYTGLVNIGNSCYMASIMQLVLSTSSFMSRYYLNQSLKKAFDLSPVDPTVDLNMQLTKLAHGLLSGKYSVPALENGEKENLPTPTTTAKQEGIHPNMFKAVIAAKHPEFSSMRQQDALEFFLHVLDQVEKSNAGETELDPTRSFKFGVEERILCPSGKVTYNRRQDYFLSLSIPLHEASNKELESYDKLKAVKIAEGKEISGDEIVRPRVPLEACLANFSAPEDIHDFYSTALQTKTTALKTAGLTSFPNYLVLHMRRFVMEAGWVPKKLEVYVDVPDIIDISHMRSKGQQDGDELLPDGGPDEEDSKKTLANEEIVLQLASMGFNHLHCQKAAINTSNVGVEEAMDWLLSHMDDQDIDIPISEGHESDALEIVDQSKVDTLIMFGFQDDVARKALKASGGDIGRAMDWIFSNPAEASDSSIDSVASDATSISNDIGLPDGGGRYRLIGIVSHIGTSTQCGHYVAHILKEGRWVIFNDDKVGLSINPPKEMGYLYFFERLED